MKAMNGRWITYSTHDYIPQRITMLNNCKVLKCSMHHFWKELCTLRTNSHPHIRVIKFHHLTCLMTNLLAVLDLDYTTKDMVKKKSIMLDDWIDIPWPIMRTKYPNPQDALSVGHTCATYYLPSVQHVQPNHLTPYILDTWSNDQWTSWNRTETHNDQSTPQLAHQSN